MSAKVTFKTTRLTNKKIFTEKERKLRQEASRLSSMANKRLKRMEEQNLINSPAYKQWVEDGGQKFGVRGKSMEQVKYEIGRLNQFLNKSTSTVTGAKKYFKNVASKIGIVKYKDMNDLQNKINNFFEITAKVKEYLYNSKEIGVAIGYQKIWEVVSDHIEEIGGEITDVEKEVLKISETIVSRGGIDYTNELLDDFLKNF